jgi:accessory secretory protein Asp2
LDEIRVLQIGDRDWRERYRLPGGTEFQYAEKFDKAPGRPYDVVFWDREPGEEEIMPLHRATKAYTLFVTEQAALEGQAKRLYECKKGRRLAAGEIQGFLDHELRNYFPKPYGEKFRFQNLAIARGFCGSVEWNGNYSVCLKGDFGEELRQAVFWRNNIPVFQGQCIDLWLEYRKSPGVEIALTVTQFVQGSIADVQQKWEFTESDLEQVVSIDNELREGPIFVSLSAKGSGELQITALHDRYSRRGHGHFLPGGERYVTSEREEIFCYFDPGDRKPPLNVYFSGYKTLEGFEGYNMMRGMGCPFLLVAEARLEGGCFYMGSEEYESMLAAAIRRYMGELGFTPAQVILSGLSMGTFGALYYGCDIMPHVMILGKPLASIGNVAANERLLRPGGFPTSLDVLHYLCGSTDKAAVERLNGRFWNKFDGTDWSRSKFVVSYMLEDDYDMDAYAMLLSHLQSEGVQVYGKGLHGRHNDNTGGIVNWFSGQFERLLREDFGRAER